MDNENSDKGKKNGGGMEKVQSAESALWQKMELKACLSLSDRMDVEAFFSFLFPYSSKRFSLGMKTWKCKPGTTAKTPDKTEGGEGALTGT